MAASAHATRIDHLAGAEAVALDDVTLSLCEIDDALKTLRSKLSSRAAGNPRVRRARKQLGLIRRMVGEVAHSL